MSKTWYKPIQLLLMMHTQPCKVATRVQCSLHLYPDVADPWCTAQCWHRQQSHHSIWTPFLSPNLKMLTPYNFALCRISNCKDANSCYDCSADNKTLKHQFLMQSMAAWAAGPLANIDPLLRSACSLSVLAAPFAILFKSQHRTKPSKICAE